MAKKPKRFRFTGRRQRRYAVRNVHVARRLAYEHLHTVNLPAFEHTRTNVWASNPLIRFVPA